MKLGASILSFMILVLFSCNNINNEYYISQIDSINTQLNEAAVGYSNVDSITIANIRKRVKTNCKRVRSLEDTVINKIFIPYSQIDKSMKQILRMDYQIKKNIKISRTQISDLLHDVNHSIIDTIVLKEYIKEEKKIVLTIAERMKYNQQRIMEETNRFDSLNPLIEQYFNKTN
ncbi:MAG: hypothetical protein HQ521_15830 [Bacteroidetes bacterium]|nr:hypothetical protein [Bacteroidota bacterium]